MLEALPSELATAHTPLAKTPARGPAVKYTVYESQPRGTVHGTSTVEYSSLADPHLLPADVLDVMARYADFWREPLPQPILKKDRPTGHIKSFNVYRPSEYCRQATVSTVCRPR